MTRINAEQDALSSLNPARWFVFACLPVALVVGKMIPHRGVDHSPLPGITHQQHVTPRLGVTHQQHVSPRLRITHQQHVTPRPGITHQQHVTPRLHNYTPGACCCIWAVNFTSAARYTSVMHHTPAAPYTSTVHHTSTSAPLIRPYVCDRGALHGW